MMQSMNPSSRQKMVSQKKKKDTEGADKNDDSMQQYLDMLRSNKEKTLDTVYGDLMQNYGITLYSTFSNLKASIYERFNRTLKSKMWMQFSLRGNHRWLDLLSGLVSSYNNSRHRTIDMRQMLPLRMRRYYCNGCSTILRLNLRLNDQSLKWEIKCE
ncbi:uncharacterized protein LOC111673967 [Orussus abietinus]|uniref:uncharacterized protein LOC111673967 n=1 Tax=Orussus abietinus TaxID=222816 RepID=UPI000C7160B5|nr:uncharacterized protein LOC111673967 [Orussus abietinus]